MKILVCGGRDFSDSQTMYKVLGELAREHDITELLHGGAKGADVMAGDWACCWDIPVRRFPADWDRHGKAAGPIRNQQMLTQGKPDLVVAFPKNELLASKGTRNMVTQATINRVPVVVVIEGKLLTADGYPFMFNGIGNKTESTS